MQLMDEEWWWGKCANTHCSSLAVRPSAGRSTLVAQTMDLPRWHDGAQALLRLREGGGTETLVFTSAGMIGLMGVSSRGLGVCVNTLSQLAVSRTGLPMAFVMRGALARGRVSEAAAFLGSVPHASGQNYQLGDRSEVRTIECSAGSAVEVPFAGACSPHTNHPLVSSDWRDDAQVEDREESRARLDRLRADLASDQPDVAVVKTALAAPRSGGIVSITTESAGLTEPMTIGASGLFDRRDGRPLGLRRTAES